ncbi:MAG: hypothetical protein R3E95_09025 [Thiolinea sp.]
MKKIAIISGMLAGLMLASSAVMAGPQSHGNNQGEFQRIQVVKHQANHNKGHQPHIPGVNIAQLEKRIDLGVRQGKLNKGETYKVRKGVADLKATLRVVLRDHQVSAWESKRVKSKYAELERDLNRMLSNQRGHGQRSDHGRDKKHR